MFKINQAIVVEGKYDKIKLSNIVDAIIVTTDGFSIYKNKEKLELIKYLAKNNGIIILTDSDTSGFKIRNYLKGCINEGTIYNVYIPDILGKEKRKVTPSKEGKLGVEGMNDDILIDAFNKAGINCLTRTDDNDPVTMIDLFELGLSGGINSSDKREKLQTALNLPKLLSTKALLEIINCNMGRNEFVDFVNQNI